MDLNKWYNKGIPVEEYIRSMEKHKEQLLHVYNHFKLPDKRQTLKEIEEKKLRVIVLTEDWCGDAMLNLPILLHIAKEINMDVRILYRDDNLELMDQYLTNGKSRSIPIFIFIDEDGNEVAKWGPRAEAVQQFVDETLTALPPKDAANYEQEFKKAIQLMTTSYHQNKQFWSDVFDSIIATLK
ncbi:MAG TPA: thioredoxin family protein [Cerasibacillus sp.]|uniref:thioredoxin family protein n=1 Tax=Cerasibacillus sp. TaxID=2498711 RepID=UPI002F3F5622